LIFRKEFKFVVPILIKRLIRPQILCATAFWQQDITATQKVIYLKHKLKFFTALTKHKSGFKARLDKNSGLKATFRIPFINLGITSIQDHLLVST